MRSRHQTLFLSIYLTVVALFALAIDTVLGTLLGGSGVVLAMAALTTDRVTPKKLPGLKSYGVAASTKIYAGAMVAVNNAGFAIPAADSANLKVVGVAEKTVDNSSGANGDLKVNVMTGIFKFNATSIAQNLTGRQMYIVDDNTFDESLGTNGVKAGKLVEFVSSTEGWIEIEGTMGVGTVLASAGGTYTSAEQNLINDLKTIVNQWIAG